VATRVTNLREFRAEVTKFATTVPGQSLLLQKKIAFDLLTKIVLRTPVGNPTLWQRPPPPGYVGGRARANWQVSITEPGRSKPKKVDPAGSETITKGLAQISNAQPFGVIWLYNNLPYIVPLEYGWSSQAPGGMVRLSLAEINAQFPGTP
jgi:hypothetical protein